jgi:hypothetical protein
VTQIYDASTCGSAPLARVDTPASPVRFLDDPHPAQFDRVDEGEPEVLHQEPSNGPLVEVCRRKVEPKRGSRQVSAIGEANLEVEVCAMLCHAQKVSRQRYLAPNKVT